MPASPPSRQRSASSAAPAASGSKAAEADQAPGELPHRFHDEVVVPAIQLRALPGEPEHHGTVHPAGVHGGQELGRPDQARARRPVEQIEGRLRQAAGLPLRADGFREDVRMEVDDHARSIPQSFEREGVEICRGGCVRTLEGEC